MEMGNMSPRQQPGQRAEHSLRSPMCLQRENPTPEGLLQLAPKQKIILVQCLLMSY